MSAHSTFPTPAAVEEKSIKESPKNNAFSISSILSNDLTPAAADKQVKAKCDDKVPITNTDVTPLWLPTSREVIKHEQNYNPLASQNLIMRGIPWFGNPYILQSLASGK